MNESVIYYSRLRTPYVRDLSPGGWAMPHNGIDGGPCHYFVLGPDGHSHPRSLCGAAPPGNAPLAASEVADTDPLAAENCIRCRIFLLIRRGLI